MTRRVSSHDDSLDLRAKSYDAIPNMALPIHTQAPSSWEQRWPQQQHHNPNYDMDTSGMLTYDSRHVSSAAIQRPVMATQYVLGNSYSEAPMPTVTTPAYDTPVSYGYSPYAQHQAPAPMATSFKPQFHDQIQPRTLVSSPLDYDRRMSYPQDSRTAYYSSECSRSPSVKAEPGMVKRMVRSEPIDPYTKSKTITPNVDKNGNPQATFNTPVDILMRGITLKVKPEADDGDVKEDSSSGSGDVFAAAQQKQEADCKSVDSKEKGKKRFRCPIAGCEGHFSQRTHLNIHTRMHTNEKPYACRFPGCGKWVSQRGNLKTHERLHTKEKPYICDQCGKAFAQRGNVRAHQRTHLSVKPFKCMLDKCDKKFGQRGNLKSHQNSFHAPTLAKLLNKFSQIKSIEDLTPEDRSLYEYLIELYKNSNKGVRGRGTGNKVSNSDNKNQQQQQMTPPQSPHGDRPMSDQQRSDSYRLQNNIALSNYYQQMSLPTPQQQHPGYQQQHHHHPELSHPAAYSISNRGPLPSSHNMMININYNNSHGLPMARDHHGVYEMFDSENDSVMGGSSTTSPTVYEEDHSRDALSFNNRVF